MTIQVGAEGLTRALRDVESQVVGGTADGLETRALAWNIPPTISREILRIATSLVSFKVKKQRLGFFLVITGLDKTGKETQAFNPQHKPGVVSVVDHLRAKGYRVLGVHQPSYNTLMGELVGAYLGRATVTVKLSGKVDPDCAWLLWSLDRAQQSEKITTWIALGEMHIAVSKRWTESNVVYQAVHGVSPSRVLAFESNVVKQDATLLLEAPIEVILSRLASQYADAYENVQTLRKASELYSRLESIFPYGKVCRIDAGPDLKTVNERVLRAVDELVGARGQAQSFSNG